MSDKNVFGMMSVEKFMKKRTEKSEIPTPYLLFTEIKRIPTKANY